MNNRKPLDEKTKKEFNKALTVAWNIYHSYKYIVENIPKEFAKIIYLDAKNRRNAIKQLALIQLVISDYDPENEYDGYSEKDAESRILNRVDRACDDIIETYESLYVEEE